MNLPCRGRALAAALVALALASGSACDRPDGQGTNASESTATTVEFHPGDGAPIPLGAWQDPPLEMRPMARWWWPGGSVEPAILRAQLERIAEAGFGAVELQPLLLGLGASDLAADPRLRTVGLPAFGQSVAAAADAAADVGLGFDLTLGSGWPGGLPTGKQNAERQLLMGTADVSGPARYEGPLPAAPDQSYRNAVEWVLDVLGPPDSEAHLVAVLAARLDGVREGVPTLSDVRVLPVSLAGAAGGAVAWDVPPGEWRIFAFYENSTEHFVMGGAFPGQEADARVVDHLSMRGADALLDGYAGPVLDAIGPGRVRALFVDSFELMGELPFTGEMLAEFEVRAGYALTPHLPLVFRAGGESKYAEMMDVFGRAGGPLYLSPDAATATRVREDYERVRAALFEERFVDRIAAWAHARGLALRLQAHGGYGDYLDVYARADVPESEGLFAAGRFDFLKLAASAAHVAGRRFAASESFITLRLFGTRLSREEMRLLAGRAYSAGINRIVYHGVPYPYTRADGAIWYPFSGGFGRILAGPLPMSTEVDAALLAELADFNLMLARLSLAMSQGEPVADVAWLRADPAFPDTASLQLGRIEPLAGESPTTGALRARGLVHDRVSRRMLAGARVSDGFVHIGAGRYRAILLDPVPIVEPGLAETLAAIAEAGIPVLALGALPERAPGLREADARDRRVRAASDRLDEWVIRVSDPGRLTAVLQQSVPGGLVEPVEGSDLSVSLERRRAENGEIILVFNESWSEQTAALRFTREGGAFVVWDPRTGDARKLRDHVAVGDLVEVDLDAAEALILTLASSSDRISERR